VVPPLLRKFFSEPHNLIEKPLIEDLQLSERMRDGGNLSNTKPLRFFFSLLKNMIRSITTPFCLLLVDDCFAEEVRTEEQKRAG